MSWQSPYRWRNTYKSPKFLIFEWWNSLACIALLIHIRYWTCFMFIMWFIVIFYIRFRLEFDYISNLFTFLRSKIAGTIRPATIFTTTQKIVDLNCLFLNRNFYASKKKQDKAYKGVLNAHKKLLEKEKQRIKDEQTKKLEMQR